jgi:hypothetical protein
MDTRRQFYVACNIGTMFYTCTIVWIDKITCERFEEFKAVVVETFLKSPGMIRVHKDRDIENLAIISWQELELE